MTIDNHFALLENLNVRLSQIRADNDIRPAMMWCPNCNRRHRGAERSISITAMYWATKRFELSTDHEFKLSLKNWKVFSAEKAITIYGTNLTEKDESKSKTCLDDSTTA